MSSRHVAEGQEIGKSVNVLITSHSTRAHTNVLYQKEAGTFNLIQFLENLEGFSLRALTAQGWQREEIQVHLAQVRNDFKNPKFRMQHDG